MSRAISINVREGYRRWAATWDSDPSAVVALETRWLLPLLPNVRDKRFLDMSCGTGRWLAWARANGALVLGTDFSAAMLSRAAAKAGLSGRLCLADSCALPVTSGWADLVLCALTLGHVAQPEVVIAEAARAAASGACVAITDLHPDSCRTGWRRTFTTGGQLYSIENHPYEIPELLHAAAHRGLRLRVILEPHFEEPERHFFNQAGKPELFEAVCHLPALLIAVWEKQ